MSSNHINIYQYIPKKIKQTNEFLMKYFFNKFNIKEKYIIKLIINYKTTLENLDFCMLGCVDDASNQSEFITQFTTSVKKKILCIYSKSWDHQMSYWATGHDIRFSYALYHNDKIWIRHKLGNEFFNKLENVIDINGIKLKDSNHHYRNYSD